MSEDKNDSREVVGAETGATGGRTTNGGAYIALMGRDFVRPGKDDVQDVNGENGRDGVKRDANNMKAETPDVRGISIDWAKGGDVVAHAERIHVPLTFRAEERLTPYF